jgi:hypothetical protein
MSDALCDAKIYRDTVAVMVRWIDKGHPEKAKQAARLALLGERPCQCCPKEPEQLELFVDS